MFRHHSHWFDVASFIALVLAVLFAFTMTIWPVSSAAAADSLAHMLQGVVQVWNRP
jgi:hypothetical protein